MAKANGITDEELDSMALAVQNARLGTPGVGWGLTDDYVKAEYRRVALAVAAPLVARHEAEVKAANMAGQRAVIDYDSAQGEAYADAVVELSKLRAEVERLRHAFDSLRTLIEALHDAHDMTGSARAALLHAIRGCGHEAEPAKRGGR